MFTLLCRLAISGVCKKPKLDFIEFNFITQMPQLLCFLNLAIFNNKPMSDTSHAGSQELFLNSSIVFLYMVG